MRPTPHTGYPAAAIAALCFSLPSPGLAETAGLVCGAERCVITVTENLSFEAGVAAVLEQPGRIEITGDVTLHTPALSLPLAQAELVFLRRDNHPEMPFELYGVARPPMAELPLFDQATLRAQPMAAVGLVSRQTLKTLLENDAYRLPLAENPQDPEGDPLVLIEPAYLFFHYESGLSLDMPLGDWLALETNDGADDPFTLSVPGDKSVTFILDPTEPYFFLSQDASAMVMDKMDDAYQEARMLADAREEERRAQAERDAQDRDSDQGGGGTDTDGTPSQGQDGSDGPDTDKKKKQEPDDGDSPLPDLGEMAFSWLGGIPFEPMSTWGLPADTGRFKGHLYLDTTLPLYKFVELTGKIVTHASAAGFEQGGNGEVQVSFDLIPNLLNFSFPLGQASAGVMVRDGDVLTYFSGIASPDYSFLPPVIPILPANSIQVAGFISSKRPELTNIRAIGIFAYDMSGFRTLTGIDLRDIIVSKAELSVDINGVWLRGSTGASVHDAITLGAEAAVEIYFSPQRPETSFMEISGEMAIAGTGLKPMRLRIDGNGLIAEGAFITPLSRIALVGDITARGPRLSGTSSIAFALGDLRDAIEAARADVVAAQRDVERLNLLVDQNRATVRAERERDAARLADARADVTAAQQTLEGLTRAIASHNSAIATYRREISAKHSWYKRQKWPKKAWAWAEYSAYAASKNAQIAWRGTQIAALTVAKTTASAALEVAKGSLYAMEQAAVTIPIDADPRVSGPLAALETARAVLIAAEAALPELPDINAEIRGLITMTLDHSGVSGRLSADASGLKLANGQVTFGAAPKACIDVATFGAVCAPF